MTIKSGKKTSETLGETYTRVVISKSPKEIKKYQAVIHYVDGKKKTIHFGAAGMEDYTTYYKKNKELAKEKREKYISRHTRREDWSPSGFDTAGFLSRFLLWEEPTLVSAVRKLNERFKKISFIIKEK